ncbi:Dabb family protein [Lewinella sp. LCG006]|uniref:Dabb family protein n=1 Tax=Lewinella sp. LCG006 TaxID=3231911 RepID=UPI00345F58F5
MKFLPFLLILMIFQSCSQVDTTAQEAAQADLQAELAAAQAKIVQLADAAEEQPGLIHSVFFWLKEDLSEADRAAFRAGVASLRAVSSVKNMYIGPVAPTEARGVVDNSYSIALLVHFADVAAQDAYQIDPIHLKFVEDHKDKWTKVVVYDSLVE